MKNFPRKIKTVGFRLDEILRGMFLIISRTFLIIRGRFIYHNPVSVDLYASCLGMGGFWPTLPDQCRIYDALSHKKSQDFHHITWC